MERGAQLGRGEGLQLAIEKAGGIGALARGLGIAQLSVSGWRRIPADRVVAVEALTGIGRAHLRPDLFMAPPPEPRPQNGGDRQNIPMDAIDHARVQEYLLLATLLLRPPSRDLLDQIAGIAGDNSPLGRAHATLAAAAQATNAEGAAAEHFNLFVGVGRGDVVPYASFYRTGFLHSRPLAHLRADLQRLGIARRDGVFEPEDHLGTMLEVMAGLVQGDFAQGEPHTAARFFKEHIEPWGERLIEDIALAPPARFYKAVAELGRLWLEIETEAFNLPE